MSQQRTRETFMKKVFEIRLLHYTASQEADALTSRPPTQCHAVVSLHVNRLKEVDKHNDVRIQMTEEK